MANTPPQVRLDTPIAQDMVTTEAGESVSGRVKADLDLLKYIMGGVVLVLAVGFVALLVTVQGLVISYHHDAQDVYKQARDATNAQNDKIDELTKQVTELTKAVRTIPAPAAP